MNTKIRKMQTAAGGNLNLFKRTNKLGETQYIYQENPESEEIILTPIDTSSSDPAKWTYKDENNREYIPREILPTPNKSYEYRTAFRPNLMADLLREQIYKTVTPQSYNIKRAAKEFFSFKPRDISKLRNFENQAWADYLGVNSGLPPSYVETDLRPTQGKTNKKVVRLLDPSQVLTPEMIHDLEAKKQAGYKPSTVIKGDEKGLGSYIVSLGKDNNEKPYASYYDDWDLELGVGKSANKLLQAFKSRGNVRHILPGDQGTELTFYDRIPYTPSPVPPTYLQKYASNPGLPSFKFDSPQINWKKKGGNIHIKESQRGSFTKYCNGKVTNECIQRGKHSPSPAIRKKATFADNARHFKHKEGGKAFVEGVNVLDSNPNMYRKKKIRKGEEGTKLQQIGQWISNNKDSISGIISGVSSLVGSGNTYNKKKDALDAQRKAFENSYADQMLDNIDLGQYAAQLKQMNPDSNYSSIDMGYRKNLLRQQAANKAKAYSNQWYQTQLNQLGNEQQQNQYVAAKAISDGVVSMMSNKNKV